MGEQLLGDERVSCKGGGWTERKEELHGDERVFGQR